MPLSHFASRPSSCPPRVALLPAFLRAAAAAARLTRQAARFGLQQHAVFSGAFSNTGQICCAIKRAFVHESIYDEFVEAIAKEAKAAKMVSKPPIKLSAQKGPPSR
jgi:acyl-CoA reductase-like NAD-dependent aldehyde dehydrogenase